MSKIRIGELLLANVGKIQLDLHFDIKFELNYHILFKILHNLDIDKFNTIFESNSFLKQVIDQCFRYALNTKFVFSEELHELKDMLLEDESNEVIKSISKTSNHSYDTCL